MKDGENVGNRSSSNHLAEITCMLGSSEPWHLKKQLHLKLRLGSGVMGTVREEPNRRKRGLLHGSQFLSSGSSLLGVMPGIMGTSTGETSNQSLHFRSEASELGACQDFRLSLALSVTLPPPRSLASHRQNTNTPLPTRNAWGIWARLLPPNRRTKGSFSLWLWKAPVSSQLDLDYA